MGFNREERSKISGTCDARFLAVREVFAEAVASGEELGASLAVDVGGHSVLDLWGGFRDPEHTAPWEENTITNLWSTTKTVTALAALFLIDRGLLDPYERVATYWPEFGVNDKEDIEVRHILSHTSGVSGWDPPFTIEDLADHTSAASRLARQAPWWEPGTASGYHVATYGTLIDELVRRVTGAPLNDLITGELAVALDADIQLGARETDWTRIAPIVSPPPVKADLSAVSPDSPAFRTFSAPVLLAEAANTAWWRRARLGAMNGHGNARSLVRSLRVISGEGVVGSERLLSRDTIDLVFHEHSEGSDLVLGVPLRFGIGFALSGSSAMPYVPEGRTCYWTGWGGSAVIANADRGVTIGYAMNRMSSSFIGSSRLRRYVETVVDCLASS
ncbi:serine hydrolase domain-containing protein [Streptomyces malaysiensis subsp. malaysiensis]|uniref:serine hydrolase domain-containing protein n=1 Tax=Streptomyces malaysiensis TaxID=92644 RepID=UPI0024C0E1E7|nr:serine hydrolase domain-containing protein [Streptomyces sp. NA07423]WHX15866.1 serine hydrolase domain-containing protein [Streptomyces sp. NA07423]